MFVDADSAGLFASEYKMDPISIKSWTGILLIFGEVPIYWSSEMRTEIIFSTLEAKYIALSQGIRELVVGRNLLFELKVRMK